MFKIEYRRPKGEWLYWMNVGSLLAIIEEKRRLVNQGFEVRVLNAKGDVVS